MDEEMIALITDSVVTVLQNSAFDSLCTTVMIAAACFGIWYLFKKDKQYTEENDLKWAARIAQAIEASRKSSSTED